MVVGYLVMRVPLIVLRIRAARQDLVHWPVAIVSAVMIALAQTGWVLTAVATLLITPTVLAAGEMAAPVVAEHKLGTAP